MLVLGFGRNGLHLGVREIPTTGNVCVIDCDPFLEVEEMIQRRSQCVGAARYRPKICGVGVPVLAVMLSPSSAPTQPTRNVAPSSATSKQSGCHQQWPRLRQRSAFEPASGPKSLWCVAVAMRKRLVDLGFKVRCQHLAHKPG